MVAILEKTEHNTDFHQIVDFLEASHIRIETTDGEKKFLLRLMAGKGLSLNHQLGGISNYMMRKEMLDMGRLFLLSLAYKQGRTRKTLLRPLPYPHEALPRVTSLGGEERVQSQDLEITQLKTRVKTLEDNERRREGFSHEDAPNMRGGSSTDEMANVLGTLGAENILASGGLRSVFTTASLLVSTASTGVSPAVATARGSFPTAVIFTTANVATPTTRVIRSSRGDVIGSSSLIFVNIPSISKNDKGKRKMTDAEQPSKEKILEQMSVQLARDLEANNAGWKAKDFKRMTFEHIEEKFILLESERLKRPGIQLEKESFKKLKTAEALGTEPTQEQQSEEPKELSEEELKKMMELVPVEELYIEALQGTSDLYASGENYPSTKGLTTLMLSNKLQVDQYSEMANELLMKIYIDW
nr:hypothetical protein [Tanacetum cinerariifolium]